MKPRPPSSSGLTCIYERPGEPDSHALVVGHTFLHAASGTFFRSPTDDDVEINLAHVTAIRLGDLGKVTEDSGFVRADHGSKRRLVRFGAEAWLQVECDSQGTLCDVKLRGANLHYKFQTGVITIEPMTPECLE